MSIASPLPELRVLPRAIAEKWRHLPLPAWVAECCGLHASSSVGDLSSVALPTDSTARAAVDFFVCELLKEREGDVANVCVFPTDVLTNDLAATVTLWPARARHALAKCGPMDNSLQTRGLTYGQLLRQNGLGFKSAIELGRHAQELPSQPAVGDSGQTQGTGTGILDDRSLESLRALATADWADLITGKDPRFADRLPTSGESLADVADTLIQTFAPAVDDNAPFRRTAAAILNSRETPEEAVRDWLRDVHHRIARLDSLHLEDLLSDFLERSSGLAGNRRDALLARLGWSGKAPITLAEAGRLLGVTRERIRQLESRLRSAFHGTPGYFPALSRALQVLVELAPLEIDEASRVLQLRGLSRVKFSPESVMAAAGDLGMDPPIRITNVKGVRLVTRAANTAHVSAILRLARKKAGASGVASAHDIAASVSGTSGTECTIEEVTTTLDASRSFRRLEGSWYWATDLPSRRNRLVNVCTAMLSVTTPISITRLRDGIKREYTFRNQSSPGRFALRVPPGDVLRDFLRDHPDFVVSDDDGVRPDRPLDYHKLLSPSDQMLVDIFRNNPSNVLDRSTIIVESIKRGLNQHTLSQSLTYSCLVEHVDTNIWTLRGSDVNPAAIEALRHANALRPRERRVRDFGWTQTGELWVAAVVPPITQSFVFGCPAGTRPYLAGQEFAGMMRDLTPCGRVRFTEDGVAYGLGVFQQVSGCDPGDIVVLSFNLAERAVTLILGNEELLDQYSA